MTIPDTITTAGSQRLGRGAGQRSNSELIRTDFIYSVSRYNAGDGPEAKIIVGADPLAGAGRSNERRPGNGPPAECSSTLLRWPVARGRRALSTAGPFCLVRRRSSRHGFVDAR